MEATLQAAKREKFGKNEANRLRVTGRIPAVLYGGASKEAESLSVDPKALMAIMHSQSGLNTLIALNVEGGASTRVLVKDYLLHPVSHKLLHADFYRIAMDKAIRVTVPVHITGTAKGVKDQGGIVDFVHRDLVIECLPGDIPGHITVDVTDLMLHQGIRVRDLAVDAKWKPLSEPDMLIVHVIAPKVEAEPTPAADATAAAAGPSAPAEPEVIKKGKIEKDDDKGKDKDKK